jgi:hypothetical protein
VRRTAALVLSAAALIGLAGPAVTASASTPRSNVILDITCAVTEALGYDYVVACGG